MVTALDAKVVAVVVTYNRKDVLASTLPTVVGQSRPPESVVVVDNASTDGTAEAFATGEFGDVEYLRLDDNLGFAAGLAAGMQHALDEGADLIWLLDDDSTPKPHCLERLIEVAGSVTEGGIFGLSGGLLRTGVPDRRSPVPPWPSSTDMKLGRADFVLVDGALVRADAARVAGFPRGDFFMMMEDVEYTSRLKRTGSEVILVMDEDLIHRGHLGSGANTGAAPPWRGYYQSRNHLRVALEHRSAREVLGWAKRQLKYIGRAATGGDQRLRRIGYRILGAVDAVRGRMGRTVDPR